MESTRHNHQSATISLIEENGEWRLVARLGDRYSEVHYFHQQIVNVGATQLFEKQPLYVSHWMAVDKKSAAPKRRTHAEVQQLVAEFTGSGMGRSEFCRSRGIGISTLVRYLRGQAKDSASTYEHVGALCSYSREFEKASAILAQREGSSPSAVTELRSALVPRMRQSFHGKVRALVQFLRGLTDGFG
jgi:hypothetical protein